MQTDELTTQQKTVFNSGTAALMPVAIEIKTEALKSMSHGKHGYILVMSILQEYNNKPVMRNMLALAIVRAGYPADTMKTILNLL